MLPIRPHRISLPALILAALVVPRATGAALDGILNAAPMGGMCMPSVTSPPCTSGDAAGLASAEPTLNLGIGNPVHLATGAKHQFDVDLPASPAHPDLEIVRHYNSMRASDSPLGTGWRFSYDARVVLHQGMAHIEQANGAQIVFDRHSDPQRDGTLLRQPPGWQWRWPNGRILDFDAQGHLLRITPQAGGPSTEIVRHRGALSPAIAQVRSGKASLQFVYTLAHGEARLAAIDSPAGRFTYQLEAVPDPVADITTRSAAGARAHAAMFGEPSGSTRTRSYAVRLTSVTRPDGMQRLYLYEADYQSGNAALPTGAVLAPPDADAHGRHGAQRLRISAWDYDAAGRAIGVSWGKRTAESGYSRIRYVRMATATRDGITRVDSPAGQTRFTIALRGSQPKLLKVEGVACPGCAAPGTHASYDEQGRLLSVNGTRIERDASGQPVAIEPKAPGWPGLRLTFSATGTRRQWQSTLTGLETVQDRAYAPTRSAVRQFANGDRMDITYDAKGRPVRIRESRESRPFASTRDAMTTTLQWRNGLLHCLRHPGATEVQRHDAKGRLIGRAELRRLSTAPGKADHAGIPCSTNADADTSEVWRIRESFQYDDQDRLTTHVLPEGGAIHYVWGAGEQLHAITWEDASGKRHPVITHVANTAGYRYGNGLHLFAAHDSRHPHCPEDLAHKTGAETCAVHFQMSLTLLDATGARWRQTRTQDARGRVLHEAFHLRLEDANTSAASAEQDPAWSTLEDWQYAYDPQDRLIGARRAPVSEQWLAWQTNGALAAMTTLSANAQAQTASTNSTPAAAYKPARATAAPRIARDPSGLPSVLDDMTLRYGVNRRLAAVDRQGQPLARYTHNAYGQRIRTQAGRVATDYLYLDNRRVADALPASSGDRPVIVRRYLYAHYVPVGMIVYSPDKGHSELYAIHADLLGAPRMVTDAHAAVRWLATYTPLGHAQRIAGDLALDLRLPGQWFDSATGLHDNLLRTYVPQWGQYLEPDPLGPVPGSQALGYAAQQPRRFVDPLGLLLFAFDGTRHNRRTNSNVTKFLQQYQDGAVYYHGGPGNPYELNLDAVTAFSAPRILEAQWFNLLTALKQANASPWLRNAQSGAIPIDLVGFSRGAALARHFGNLIVAQTHNGLFSYQHATLGLISTCVDLRFMGLLDTVAQFGTGPKNGGYDLGIAEIWRWVSHAVALHEDRGVFPLSSTQPGPNAHVIEAPFIGAHGDIGGGNLLDPSASTRHGDLADVALNWLWWQAQTAGVAVKPLEDEDQIVREAVVNNPLNLKRPKSLIPEDRNVLNAQGGILHLYQRDATHIGNTQRRAVEALILTKRLPNRRIRYEVDMDGYRTWLQQELGWGEQQLGIP